MIQRFILISNHVKAIAGIGGLDSRSPQTHREVASNVFFRIAPHRTAEQVKALVRPAFIGHSPRAQQMRLSSLTYLPKSTTRSQILFVTQRDHGIDAHGSARGYVSREYGGSKQEQRVWTANDSGSWSARWHTARRGWRQVGHSSLRTTSGYTHTFPRTSLGTRLKDWPANHRLGLTPGSWTQLQPGLTSCTIRLLHVTKG